MDGTILEVSLLTLTEISGWLKVIFLVFTIGSVIWGVATLALQNCSKPVWEKSKSAVSLAWNAIGVLLFIISQQPYAAIFLFIFLAIKVVMLFKKS